MSTKNKLNINEVVIDGVTMVPKDTQITPVQEGTVGVWEIGEKYFVRTVTYHLVGELVHVNDMELVFKNASWVASSGQFNEALKNGSLHEVEPFQHPVIMGRGAIVDATKWTHDLPTEPI